MPDLINFLATALTFETGILSNIKDLNMRIDQKKLQRLSAEVNYEKIAGDLEFYAQAADDYIAKQHSHGKKAVGDGDRERFIEAFYNKNPKYISVKDFIDPYLNSYLDQLNDLLTGMMTAGEKFLNKRATDILESVQGIKGTNEEIKIELHELKRDVEEIKDAVSKTQKTLDNTLTLIDHSFLEEHKSENFERCRFEYYNIVRSADSIFKAIINGVSISTDKYEEISTQIYNTIKSSPALFLMADSSTGKSTLLCKVGVKFAADGYKVYFADNTVEVPKFWKIEEETFFLIDNASFNVSLISRLYDLWEKNRYIHVILCDRIHRMNTLIGEINISGWISDGKGIVFKNSLVGKYYTPLRKKNVTEIILSEEIRKKMSDATIASTVAYEELNAELAEKVKNQLVYNDRSVDDITLAFFVAYNTATGENLRPSKGHLWDWDVWDEVVKLEGSFKYLAALNLYGVNATVYQMERITGANISELVNNGKLGIIRLVNNVIWLRHDTIADNYFKIKHIKPADVVKELFETRMLVEDTVVRFERKAFSLSNIFQVSEGVKYLQIPELIHAFNRIEKYRNILTAHRRIHSLELATIGVNAKGVPDKGKYYRERIGKSYAEICSAYKSNTVVIWLKYFFFAVDHAEAIPEELFTPLSTIPGFYKKITKSIDDYVRRAYRNYTKEEQEKWLVFLEQLFNWIVDNINKDDVPSRILLLWVYRRCGKAEQAKKIVYDLLNLQELARRTSEFSVADIQTYEIEVRQLVKTDRKDLKIRKINRSIRQYYQKLTAYTDSNSKEYVTVIRSFVRFQKDSGHYDEAYHLAKKTAEDMSKNAPQIPIYRLYIELGMICQHRNSRNTYYNPEEAIVWFEKAIETIEKTSRELLFALKPLCKSYLYAGLYEKCLITCKKIKNLDFRDREVNNLQYEAIRLLRVKELNLPVGKQYRWEEKPNPEEVTSEFEKLIGEMTEEQLAFAEMFGLMQHKPKFADYRVAFSIVNNIYIPRSILSKLDITDTTIVDRLI